MAANLFNSAPTVEIKSAAVEKEIKNKTRTVDMGETLDSLAAINALITSLESVSTIYHTKLTEKMSEEFTDEAMRVQKRPDNFHGKGQVSESSCELRKRSARSYLTPEEVELLKANNIKFNEEVISEEIPEHYFFNPEVLSDPKIAELISLKLGEIPELRDKQVIMKQAKRDKVVRNNVAEEAFDQIAKLQDRELVKKLLGVVGTLGLKPKLQTQDIDVVLDLVRKSGVKL